MSDDQAKRKLMIEEGRKFGDEIGTKIRAMLVAGETSDDAIKVGVNAIIGGEVEFRAQGIEETDIKLWSREANKIVKRWIRRANKNA